MTSYAIFIAFFQSAKLWKQTRLNKSSLLPEQTLHTDSAETYCVSFAACVHHIEPELPILEVQHTQSDKMWRYCIRKSSA